MSMQFPMVLVLYRDDRGPLKALKSLENHSKTSCKPFENHENQWKTMENR